jgi:hypothetical protein
MTRSQTQFLVFSLSLLALAFTAAASAQSCPKVAYTTPAATTKAMVMSVNCLVARSAPARAEVSKAAFQVESFPVVGPQHTRSYRKIVLAMLAVPTATETKTALATADNPAATVSGTAGAECKLKINSDNTVDGQCNQTGGTLFVVYNN